MADNVALFQVGCAPRVDAAVVNWVVVALAEEVSFEFPSLPVLDLLYAGDAMHDWDVLPVNVVNDDIADVDLVILEEDQDVATVHRRLHRADLQIHLSRPAHSRHTQPTPTPNLSITSPTPFPHPSPHLSSDNDIYKQTTLTTTLTTTLNSNNNNNNKLNR